MVGPCPNWENAIFSEPDSEWETSLVESLLKDAHYVGRRHSTCPPEMTLRDVCTAVYGVTKVEWASSGADQTSGVSGRRARTVLEVERTGFTALFNALRSSLKLLNRISRFVELA